MRSLLPLTLAALALLPATPAAAAQPTPGEVTATGVQFLYAARQGEENHVVVTQTGNYVTLSDSGSGRINITAGSACTQTTPTSPTSVTCATAPGWVLGIDVGNGDDTVTVDSTLGAEILGGNGNDGLDGGDGADLIGGQNGDDVIRGDGGADILGGNEGNDTIDYSTSLQPVTVTPDASADDGALGEGDFVQDTFENVRGSANGDDLTANANGGTVDGGPGADTLRGGPGVDVLNGGGGDDRILSLDGLSDQLACGDGADSAQADEVDVIAGDCESDAYAGPDPADESAATDDEGADAADDTPRVAAVVGERAKGKVLVTVGGKTREAQGRRGDPAERGRRHAPGCDHADGHARRPGQGRQGHLPRRPVPREAQHRRPADHRARARRPGALVRQELGEEGERGEGRQAEDAAAVGQRPRALPHPRQLRLRGGARHDLADRGPVRRTLIKVSSAAWSAVQHHERPQKTIACPPASSTSRAPADAAVDAGR